MRLSKNFKLEEFKSRDSDLFPLSVLNNIEILVKQLEIIRTNIGDKPIRINSGYRTNAHNEAVGGSPTSQHLLGKAADIWVPGMNPEDLYKIVVYLRDSGLIAMGGIGIYNTFVHYDIRGYRADWDYRTKK